MKGDFTIHLPCPWPGCPGEILADNRVKLQVSVMCGSCSRRRRVTAYIANLYAMKTYRSKPRDAKNFPHHVRCPCCGKGEFAADGTADARISVICSKCGSAYIVDLQTMTASPAQKIKKQRRKK